MTWRDLLTCVVTAVHGWQTLTLWLRPSMKMNCSGYCHHPSHSTHLTWPTVCLAPALASTFLMSQGLIPPLFVTRLCLKQTTLMLHTITSMHIYWFWYILAEVLLRGHAINWWFIPPLLTNVSALSGETWRGLQLGLLRSIISSDGH